MARQSFSDGDTGLTVRTVIDDNFEELYDTYLPLAGGDMTDRLGVKTATQVKASEAIATNVLTLSLSAASFFTVTLDQAISTLTLTQVPASPLVYTFSIQFAYGNTTTYAVTWPASFKWSGGFAPTLTCNTGKYDLLTFLTHDGGTTWFAFVSELNQ
jgi:hypothetical protein